MNAAEKWDEGNHKRVFAGPGLYAARDAKLAFAALLLYGCVSTIARLTQLPESSDLPEGHGTVIGSILLSVPTGALSIHQREMIDALQAKPYEAVIGRFITYEYGFASRTEHPEDKFRFPSDVDINQPFVIRAPAGTYSFPKISQIIRGIFGEKNMACRMEGVANFNIHAGKTTYVSQLTIAAGFMSDSEEKMRQAVQTIESCITNVLVEA